MVGFNFSAVFADAVASGRKTRTIRLKRRGNVGDRCQHYTGMRTKQCRKLVDPDPVLREVTAVTLTPDMVIIGEAGLRGAALQKFAELDGFKDYDAMYAWLAKRHRKTIIDGYLHDWGTK